MRQLLRVRRLDPRVAILKGREGGGRIQLIPTLCSLAIYMLSIDLMSRGGLMTGNGRATDRRKSFAMSFSKRQFDRELGT